jgi:predicted amidohydrolase
VARGVAEVLRICCWYEWRQCAFVVGTFDLEPPSCVKCRFADFVVHSYHTHTHTHTHILANYCSVIECNQTAIHETPKQISKL